MPIYAPPWTVMALAILATSPAEAQVGYAMQRQLAVKQENAIDMLVVGANDAEWHRRFQAELNRRRQAIWGTAVDRLRALLPRARDAMGAELSAGRHRVRAAVSILQLVGRSGVKSTLLAIRTRGQRLRMGQESERRVDFPQ